MLLQLLGPRFGWLEIALILIFVGTVFTMLYVMAQREKARLFNQANSAQQSFTNVDLDQPAAAPEPSTIFKLRKWVPVLAFLAALLVFLFLRPALHSLLSAGAPIVAPDAMNATSEQVVADQVSGGYVQAGSLFSKIVIAVLFYALFSFVPWLFQQVTHPAFAAWKKEKYKTDFEAMTVAEKFSYDKGMAQAVAIRVLAAVVPTLIS